MVKKTTNEELARMIKVGFDDVTGRISNINAVMATKEDLRELKTDLENRMNRLEAGQSEIKDSLIPKLDFEDLEGRIKYVETKLSIESGK